MKKRKCQSKVDNEGVALQQQERGYLRVATVGCAALLLAVAGSTVWAQYYNPGDEDKLTISGGLPEAQGRLLPGDIPVPTLVEQNPFTAIAYNTNYNVDPVLKIKEIEELLGQVDVVGAQEFTEDDKKEIAKALALCIKCEFNGYIPDNRHSETALFWHNKRFKLDKLNYYQLHEKDKTYINNSDGTRSKIKQKTLIVASGVDLVDNRPIAFLVFHDIYDHVENGLLRLKEIERIEIYYKERQKLIEKITELIDQGIPMVVLGDLNEPPGLTDEETLEYILKNIGLQSMYDSDVLNLTPKEHYTHDESKMDFDYILALSSVFNIIQRKNLGDWESDHDPVWAKITKKVKLISIS